MLQNKQIFNQSSVSLELIGIPDYSNNEDKDFISIISKWKLIIIDKPLIEGSLEHLNSIMQAFYYYSEILLKEKDPLYESNLIDIRTVDFFIHDIVLKSSKPDVKPLNIKIGNAILSDIINCFDQLITSNKIKINLNQLPNISKRNNFIPLYKRRISNLLLPPIISLCSLFIVSTPFIYYYNFNDNKDSNSLSQSRIRFASIETQHTIL